MILIFTELLIYFLYLIFLLISNNLYLVLVLFPLVFALTKNNKYFLSASILALLFADVNFLFHIKNEYSYTNMYNAFNQIQPGYFSKFQVLISLILFVIFNFLSLKIIKSNFLTFLFTTIAICLFNISSIKTTSGYIEKILFLTSIIVLIKIWITALLRQQTNVQKNNFLANLLIPSPFSRENFNIFEYLKPRQTKSIFIILLCSILSYLIFYQMSYSILGDVNSYYFFNSSLNLNCNMKVMTDNLGVYSTPEIWTCFAYNEFISGFVKHFFMDNLIFIIIPLMVGFQFKLPFENPFTKKTIGGVFFSFNYYYSLIIYNIFILNIYPKMIKTFGRSEIVKRVSIILSIFIGGYTFHISRDFHYLIFDDKYLYFDKISSSNMLIYFALLSVLSTIKIPHLNNKFINYFIISFCIFIFILLRTLSNSFFMDISIDQRISFVARLFNVSIH